MWYYTTGTRKIWIPDHMWLPNFIIQENKLKSANTQQVHTVQYVLYSYSIQYMYMYTGTT